ncbi:M48 family metallopeptidase [Nitrososphaera viennensis]|uniref:M48 family metallopeptidase n=2 Tax=Nitrososphaera viennensis TaxID=1034015 RepID=A0A977ICK3_9ARCH|nr:SprT family zinc-dependent metalloprotease [Nitrososphaera viennensis]AIC16477.1 putative metal-dependent hydrolase [Nitrososphaera viennensis EN76]UVS68410.1 M48 family metallopeptidase [Nitrososphaera viennensis]
MMMLKTRHGKSTITYTVIRGKRIKTSEIIIEKGKVVIRTPPDKPLEEIEKIIQKKAEWILKKQQEYKRLAHQIARPTFKPDSTLPYLGKNYPLYIMGGRSQDKLRFVNGEFLATTKSQNPSEKAIRKLYQEWLMKSAMPIMRDSVKFYANRLGVKPQRVIIKDLKNRWGSATKSGTVNLNVNLLKAPQDVIDYIVLHELCHFEIKDHSHHFWNLLHKFMPSYEKRIEWLRVNAGNLI